MELSITLNELESILNSLRDREERNMRFMASLQGIDMDEQNQSELPTLEEKKRKAQAILEGKTEEQLAFAEFGIGVTKE